MNTPRWSAPQLDVRSESRTDVRYRRFLHSLTLAGMALGGALTLTGVDEGGTGPGDGIEL